ncbi:MAG: PfaD family polyunsaturated fatty acid/polyketide biosynthesis protein [Desulfuromonas sp.]|nr:PfaD family polyunsaturated fatty acid/polyketide biosynthesis protein [Desulfuromonas sp.]
MVSAPPVIGSWTPPHEVIDAASISTTLAEALKCINRPVFVTNSQVANAGCAQIGDTAVAGNAVPLQGYAAPLPLKNCGDPQFLATHGLRYPMVGGSMAKGISSAEIAIALGQNGMLGFFGAAGLPLEQVEETILRIQSALPDGPYGFNLIHSPNEPDLEQALVDLYIKHHVPLIEASAFLALSLTVVQYRVHGIHRDSSGQIVTPNRIMAKVSREEVASQFLSPPPQKMLDELMARQVITAEQAELALQIPMAEDITAEADSGGHTDNRPALSLFPTICSLRDRLQKQYNYAVQPRIGLAGGIATPLSAAAALAMGAAYLVTGTVNQACIESGTSDMVRQMLAEARQADIAMAPAADMFEMGVDVQVLKRGTMFSMRAAKLYELYRHYPSLDQLPADERTKLEKTFFRAPLTEVWNTTRAFFMQRDPRQVQRAEQDPKHLMALVFRSYLGQATHWANDGDASRKMDFQIWCGPAMGAFNEWTAETFLQQPANRQVVCVNLNILFGAAVISRANILRHRGLTITDADLALTPLTTEQIKEYLRD